MFNLINLWKIRRTAYLNIVTEKNEEVSIEELKSWGHKKISNYKLPKIIKVVESLPKNSLGKVNKPKLKEAFQ